MTEIEILTPREAAQLTGMGVNKIRRLCEQGAFGVNTSLGARPTWKIRRQDVLDYITPKQQMESAKEAKEKRAPAIDAGVEKVF